VGADDDHLPRAALDAGTGVRTVAGAMGSLGGGRSARARALVLLAQLPLLHGWGSAPGLAAPWARPASRAWGRARSTGLARAALPPRRTPPPPPPKRDRDVDLADELPAQEVIEKEEWEAKKGR